MKKTNLLIVLTITLFALGSFGNNADFFWTNDPAAVNNDFDPNAPTTMLDSVPGTMRLRIKTPLNFRSSPVFHEDDVYPGLQLSDYIQRVLQPGVIVNVLENNDEYYKIAAPIRQGNTVRYEVGYIWKSDRYAEHFVPSADELNNPGVPNATPEGDFAWSGDLEHPLCGCTHARCRVTSIYGMRYIPGLDRRRRMHWGVDFAGPIGTPVYAAADGVVSSTSCGGGYGICMIVNHRSELRDNRGRSVSTRGFQTLYSHLSRKLVSPGTRVRKGQLIARVGQTGNVTGPNNHFEVRANGERMNPARFFPRNSVNRGSRYPQCGSNFSRPAGTGTVR